jgi:hypothetical protein
MLDTFITEETVLADIDRTADIVRTPMVAAGLRLVAALLRQRGSVMLSELRTLLRLLAIDPADLGVQLRTDLSRTTMLLQSGSETQLLPSELLPGNTFNRFAELATMRAALHQTPQSAGALVLTFEVRGQTCAADRARLLRLVELMDR